ncbi:MAG: hypothetical protein HGA33_00840 [Candidatus Moranbacteria bacterium]|nr:hypothetical protein [Candidatus Moranbacteria bacterium]
MEERLKKIIALAKQGEGGEKENAIMIIKKICENKDLNFDDVMSDRNEDESFEFYYKGLLTQEIAFQIYFKVIGGGSVSYNSKYIFLKCTQEKFEEFQVAFYEYRRIYKKERKAFDEKQKLEKKVFSKAFIQRYELYSDLTEEQEKELREKRAKKEITAEDIREAELAARMACDMEEEAFLHKRLK